MAQFLSQPDFRAKNRRPIVAQSVIFFDEFASGAVFGSRWRVVRKCRDDAIKMTPV